MNRGDSTSRFETRRVAGGWALVSTRAPVVSATTPPPPGMPPLWLVVLDSLVVDSETLDTLRDYGNVSPFGLALVGENHILDALRTLLADGLIEILYELAMRDGHAVTMAVPSPQTDDASLRRYWYQATAAGKTAWHRHAAVLDAWQADAC